MKVATCVSCHDRPHGSGKETGKHGVVPASDMNSPVYPTRVAATCAKCHADKTLMAGRRYNDKPLPCDEYAKWRASVHGRAMMDKGDLSAATCNNCHGNHGAAPPQIDAVANACGTCHGKNAKLFSETLMKHKFRGRRPARLRHLPRQSRHRPSDGRDVGDGRRGGLRPLPCQRQVRRDDRRRGDGEAAPQGHRQAEDRHREGRSDAGKRRAVGHGGEPAEVRLCGLRSTP